MRINYEVLINGILYNNEKEMNETLKNEFEIRIPPFTFAMGIQNY